MSDYKGTWDKYNFYDRNDIVDHKNKVYVAKSDSYGNEPPHESWKLHSDLSGKVNQEPEENSELFKLQPHDMDTLYGEGSLVSHKGKAYKAIQEHMGIKPSNKSYWKHTEDLQEKPEEIDEAITGSKKITKDNNEEKYETPLYTPPDKSVFVVTKHIIERDGKQGAPGLKGDRGIQGPQGLQGIQGEKGDKGETGKDGASYKSEELDELKGMISGMGSMNRFTVRSVGTGHKLVQGVAKPRAMDLKTIAAGTNISISDSGGTLTINSTSGGSGTVTSVSVVSANGFAGTVATATTTPAITLTTSISGLIKGNSGALTAATAGSDYQAPISLTTTGTSGAATLISNVLNVPQYSGASPANPIATAGPTAINGTATTFMRSDAAPAVQTATTGQEGLVKPDGTTITISGGVISSVGGTIPAAQYTSLG